MTALSLPPALAPWAAWLRLFPAELALSLGPMTQRLAGALGPFAVTAQLGQGEPDGFSGLDRRGPYERLLASEWLLAELAPDEFLRRAAASEHAFLRLERREPAMARATVVLFDAGPSQLGSPRLAHLAALVAFARRAEVAGAALAWGVLQEPAVPLVDEVTRAGVRALLARRTVVPPAAAHSLAWRTCLEKHVAKDIWIVGGVDVGEHAWPGVATVALRDVLAPGPPELIAVLRAAAGRLAEVRLPLPDGPSGVRLLRDPFPPEPVAPVATDRRRTRRVPVTNLVITPRGDHVFAGAEGSGVIAYPIPRAAKAGVGRPKLHFSELLRRPAAVGWYNRGVAAVAVLHDGAAIFSRKNHRSAHGLEALRYHDERLPLAHSQELRLLRFYAGGALFHAGDGKLFTLGAHADKSPRLECIATSVFAVGDGPGWYAYLSSCEQDDDAVLPYCKLVVVRPPAPPETFVLHPAILHGAYFTSDTKGGWQCAIAHESGRWKLHSEDRTAREWTTDDRVIGLLAAHHLGASQQGGPALVTLTSERNFLAVQGDLTRLLTTADEPVVHATIATVTGHLAYVTTRRTVVVLGPPHYDAPLARFVVEDP